MNDISDLIKEAKPMYFSRKRRRKAIKAGLPTIVCLLAFTWFNPYSYNSYNEYDYWTSEIAYIENGSVVSDMGLPVDEYGLLMVV